jgi:hypothetical protein
MVPRSIGMMQFAGLLKASSDNQSRKFAPRGDVRLL